MAEESAASGSVVSAASAACLRCARRAASWRRAREGGMLSGCGTPVLDGSVVVLVVDWSLESCYSHIVASVSSAFKGGPVQRLESNGCPVAVQQYKK
jgi:hypothetical protein